MPRTATANHYTYLDCPECGQGIAEPFAVPSGPIPFVHGHGRNQCRLMVWPEEDRIQTVPHHMSLEEATRRSREHLSEQGWTLGMAYSATTLATAA